MKLFSKRKNKIANAIPVAEKPYFNHAHRIYKGLLYDTEKSELVMNYQLDGFDSLYSLFKTKNGRWFRCQRNIDICNYVSNKEHIRRIYTTYYDIVTVDVNYAKRIIGENDIQKYIDLWGDEVEEA